MKSMLSMADKNGDGKLSVDELVQAGADESGEGEGPDAAEQED